MVAARARIGRLPPPKDGELRAASSALTAHRISASLDSELGGSAHVRRPPPRAAMDAADARRAQEFAKEIKPRAALRAAGGPLRQRICAERQGVCRMTKAASVSLPEALGLGRLLMDGAGSSPALSKTCIGPS